MPRKNQVISTSLLLFCLHLASCSSVRYKSYPNDGSNKPLTTISKHHQTKVRTYFVHKGDEMVQLFNIAFDDSKEETKLTGYIIETDSLKVDQYHKMKDNSKYKPELPEENKLMNQAHIFVSEYEIDKTKKITIDNTAILRYDVYESPESNPKMSKGLQVAIIVGGTAAFVGGVLFLWSLRPTWQN